MYIEGEGGDKERERGERGRESIEQAITLMS